MRTSQIRPAPLGNPQSEIAIDVLCVGHAAFDITMQVARHPGPDEKTFAESLLECGGGPAANAAVAVARLGGRSAFAGYLGNDIYGTQHYRELANEGVNTELLIRGEHPTPLSIIVAKPDGERTVINYKNLTPPLDRQDCPFPHWKPRVILFDGHEPLISASLVKFAKTEGIPTILDAGSVHRGTAELSSLVDYLVASVKFARNFSGKDTPEEALSSLSRLAPSVIITLGKQGLIWQTGKVSGKLPAFPVKAIDTTGAGDAFHGAFALGIARDYKFAENLKFASAAAALVCTKLGARPGLPTAGEVDSFLKNFPE